MPSKADITSDYIVKKVAPVFNKHGYSATSMADLTEVTGLTKGAIYGNFKNKEELAFVAFKHNVDFVIDQIKADLAELDSPLQQLYALTNFYRRYRSLTIDYGGCPIVNIGVDANNNNPELLEKVQQVISKLQYYITKMVKEGIKQGEIKKTVNPEKYGRLFYTVIEGAVFMTTTMNDEKYLQQMMDHLDEIITNQLAN